MPIINSAHWGILNDPDIFGDKASSIDENEKQDVTNLCKICYAWKANIALIPCGHSNYCKDCVMKLDTECPLCWTPISGKIKIFK